MLKHIDHVNIVVRDLDAMVGFYRDVLGMTVAKRVTISGDWIASVIGLADAAANAPAPHVRAEVVYLDLPGGPRIELIDYQQPAGDRPPGLDAPHTHGLRHLAFAVDDIDVASTKLASAGVALVGSAQRVPDSQVTYAGGVRKRLVYFRDPEGNLLELCEYR